LIFDFFKNKTALEKNTKITDAVVETPRAAERRRSHAERRWLRSPDPRPRLATARDV